MEDSDQNSKEHDTNSAPSTPGNEERSETSSTPRFFKSSKSQQILPSCSIQARMFDPSHRDNDDRGPGPVH